MRIALLPALLLSFGLPGITRAEPESATRPNIVFLVADDLGWADVGWHKGEIQTPHLDQLAHGGARLESHYVLPVCSPTRAALMTGRYPIRHGLQVGVVRPWAQYGLPLEEQLISQGLKSAGYTTAICGKWHLGHYQPAYLPMRRGFDHQYGNYNGAIDYNTHMRDGGFDWHRDDKVCRDEGYSTHLVAREAVNFIGKQSASAPFFLYVPFNAVHAPHQVPAKYLEPYAHLKGPRKVYAGMVSAMDEAIGQIVAAIDKKGVRKQTLIVFTSDNGGPQPGVVTSNGPLRAGKATLYEGGIRVAACANWQGVISAQSEVTEPIHAVDWYPTLLGLAQAKVEQKQPLDGKDIWETIVKGKPTPHKHFLLNATPNGGAVRAGDWKLLVNGNRAAENRDGAEVSASTEAASVELFHLKNDPYEKTNLAAANPAKVKELQELLDEYAKGAVAPKARPKPPGFKTPKVWGES
jgi:arylsulfatase A-like enzyme